MAGYSWEGCPAAGGFVWLLPMRARTRSTTSYAPCTGLRQAALREALRCRVWTCATGGLPSPRGPGERLVKRTRRGAASRLRRGRTCWCSATTPPATLCYQSSGRCSTYRICTTSATSTDCLDRAPQQVLYIPLLCGHRNKRRPRSARNKAARASRQKTPREALTITPSARASRAQNHGRL